MEVVEIALAVSIVVVLVLLMSCWKGKKQSRKTKGSCQRRQKPMYDMNEEEEYSYGTATKNRAFENRYNNVAQNLDGYNDYSEVLRYTALQPEVYTSHKSYVEDMDRVTAGASSLAERSDDNDFINWHVRRPNYRDVVIGDDARITPSEFQDQKPERTYYPL